MKNYYQILEVNENASYEVIEKAYRVLAKKYHPDLWPKDKMYFAESKFKEITEAYNILSNNDLKAEYDARMGFNVSSYSRYNNLYNENQKLKQELNSVKIKSESQKYTDDLNSKKSFYFKKYSETIKELIRNETKKDSDERSRDLTALILTLVTISIIVLIFWKVPFLNNLLFP
jgi:DnaJ-class molecular chaperone